MTEQWKLGFPKRLKVGTLLDEIMFGCVQLRRKTTAPPTSLQQTSSMRFVHALRLNLYATLNRMNVDERDRPYALYGQH